MISPTRFIFDSFELNTKTREIKLHYALDPGDMHFTETITLPADAPLDHADSPDVQRMLFALHLAGGASYYKAFCPPEIVVNSGTLNTAQAAFWNEFYTKGLGEFFYQNKLKFHGLVAFPAQPGAPTQPLPKRVMPAPKKALVPFGGGKDSQVTVELLSKNGIGVTLFRMQGHQFITELAELNKLPLLQVGRSLDPQLFDLNKQGVMNGHIPITGYVTFLTLAMALLYGYDSVFFSNERSSDYGNVEYLGMEVNHQWSKSNQAELMIRHYVTSYVTTQTEYLNALRPLSELHIAKLFARIGKPYFAHVTSCNRNWLWQKLNENPNQSRWCGECDKCAFVFALFAAFMPAKTLVGMFGQNLFDNAALLHQYRQLWGAVDFKPFECVGTPQETKAAMYLATRSEDFAKTAVGQAFIHEVLPHIQNPEGLVAQELTPDYSDVQPYIASLVKKEVTHDNSRP